MADDSTVLLSCSREIPWHIHEGDDGDIEDFTEVHETSIKMTKFFNLKHIIFMVDSCVRLIKHIEKWTNTLIRI